jgi:hypothetical protein
MAAALFGHSSAVLSDCGTYRYELHRSWDPAGSLCAWVMLNPSMADADLDDPTIRRCRSFSRSWDYGGIVVVNLYALRATDPEQLRRHPDPVADNDGHITATVYDAAVVGCASLRGPASGRRMRATARHRRRGRGALPGHHQKRSAAAPAGRHKRHRASPL